MAEDTPLTCACVFPCLSPPADADTWPVLINYTNGLDLSYSYFVPADSTLMDGTDPSVTLLSRPEVTVYVR